MNLRYLLFYSYRNLGRNRRRTALMIFSLGLGVAFMLVNMNFSHSGLDETKREFLSHFTGEKVITRDGYYHQEDKRKFNKYKVIKDEDFQDSGLLEKTSARTTSLAFAASDTKSAGVLMVGIQPEQEQKLSTLSRALIQGSSLTGGPERGMILGARLARLLKVKTGEQVSLIGQALDGSVANDNFTIRGVLDLGGGDLEGVLVIVDLKASQEFLSAGETYHQRIVFPDAISGLAKAKLPANLHVTTWEELMPDVAVSMRFSSGFLWILSLIVAILVSVGLSNSLMISFFQREKEFQALNVIGARGNWVTLSLLIEGMLMVSLGIAAGLVLGSLVSWALHVWPINMQWLNGGQPLLLGGMKIDPMVRISAYTALYWQIPLLVYFFFGLTMLYPLFRVRTSKT